MKWLRWIPALTAVCVTRAVELNDSNFEQWRDRIVPAATELGYTKIAWRTSYWDAVIEAQEKEKPVLLWTMNGHPLGCT